MVGIEETAKQAALSLKQMIELKYQLEEDIQKNWGRRSKQGYALLQSLFQNPVVHMKEVQTVCKLSPKAAGDLVNLFEDKKILKELTGKSRNRIFIFEHYLDLFK